MKKIFVLCIAILCGSHLALSQNIWQRQEKGLNGLTFKCIRAHPKISDLLFAGSLAGVYRSADCGKTWKRVLSLRDAVNYLLITSKGEIYAASTNGLYLSLDDGLSWQRVLRGRSKIKNISVLTEGKNILYLGTQAGLYIMHRENMSLEKPDSGLREIPVYDIAVRENNVYLVNTEGFFKSMDNAKSFVKVLPSFAKSSAEDEELDMQENEEEKSLGEIRCIALAPDKTSTIYLGTEKGILKSEDTGNTWQDLSSTGLSRTTINDILILDGQIYLATDKGVFLYHKEKESWEALYQGMPAAEVFKIAADNFSRKLWIATDKGIFSMDFCQETKETFYTKKNVLGQEPDIRQVQVWAIDYAEVQAEKIANWRRQAAKRAWLPQLKVGANRDTADLWHWETGSTTKIRDDILVKGRDSIEYDVSLTWDLADLVFNDAQTSIDVRSRLMVELRNDILEEVNRAYFERRRIQLELESAKIEPKKKMEKELRIAELTAVLDGFTAGKFSQAITKKKNFTFKE